MDVSTNRSWSVNDHEGIATCAVHLNCDVQSEATYAMVITSKCA